MFCLILLFTKKVCGMSDIRLGWRQCEKSSNTEKGKNKKRYFYQRSNWYQYKKIPEKANEDTQSTIFERSIHRSYKGAQIEFLQASCKRCIFMRIKRTFCYSGRQFESFDSGYDKSKRLGTMDLLINKKNNIDILSGNIEWDESDDSEKIKCYANCKFFGHFISQQPLRNRF